MELVVHDAVPLLVKKSLEQGSSPELIFRTLPVGYFAMGGYRLEGRVGDREKIIPILFEVFSTDSELSTFNIQDQKGVEFCHLSGGESLL